MVGLLLSALEPYSLFSPNIVGAATREVIAIVTKIDHPRADVPQAVRWLELTGCRNIFPVSSTSGAGIGPLLEHLGALPPVRAEAGSRL